MMTNVQKVAIVNGTPDVLKLLEPVLGVGRYAVVFVESTRHAYSDIKRLQPNLIILCLDIADAAGFHVLSMLKLDDDTRRIPLVTFTSDFDGAEPEDVPVKPADAEMFMQTPALGMN
jgi:CheY-like chemotaxis protein